MKKKIVYISLSADVIHHGHINLINQARKYGTIIVGLLTDKAIASTKRLPLLNYSQRKKILMNINGIDKIIQQNEWDYSPNLLKLKPDYMIHGDDWKVGRDKVLREKTISTLKKIGSKLIEIPHTKNISSSSMQTRMYEEGLIPKIKFFLHPRKEEYKFQIDEIIKHVYYELSYHNHNDKEGKHINHNTYCECYFNRKHRNINELKRHKCIKLMKSKRKLLIYSGDLGKAIPKPKNAKVEKNPAIC